jgi:hypothetical protein
LRANFGNFDVDVSAMTKKKELIEQPKEKYYKSLPHFFGNKSLQTRGILSLSVHG